MKSPDDNEEWIQCCQCQGDEGWYDLTDDWVVCDNCEGDGGWWEKTPKADEKEAKP